MQQRRHNQSESGETLVRNPSLETLRVASAAAIVWYHAGAPRWDIAYGGLIAFVMLTGTLSCGPNLKRSIDPNVLIRRLIMPWLIAAAVYSVVLHLRGKQPDVDAANFVSAILVGPSKHLWYPVFALMYAMIIGYAKKILSLEVLAVLSLTICVVLFSTIDLWRARSIVLGPPWAQYVHVLPMAAIGNLIGLAFHGWFERICLVIGLFSLIWSDAFEFEGVGVSYASGLAALGLGLVGGLWWKNDDISYVSSAMFGVYLYHPLVLGVLRSSAGMPSYVNAVLAFIVTLIVILIIRSVFPRFSVYAIGRT